MKRRHADFSRAFGLLLAFLVLPLQAGWFSNVRLQSVEPFQPENYRQTSPWLPDELRRVAVLPLVLPEDNYAAEKSLPELEQDWRQELARTGKFELIPVTESDLKRWTGKTAWDAADALPVDFFEILREKTDCDAVIFASVTVYKGYPQPVVGWKARLVDARNVQTWWSADLLFDSGEAPVAEAARRFNRDQLQATRENAHMILSSPRRFARYTMAGTLGTIQPR